MSINETLFNPQNDSLAERVSAYRCVAQAFSHSQASINKVAQEAAVDYLGNKEEVEDAYAAISQSFRFSIRGQSKNILV